MRSQTARCVSLQTIRPETPAVYRRQSEIKNKKRRNKSCALELQAVWPLAELSLVRAVLDGFTGVFHVFTETMRGVTTGERDTQCRQEQAHNDFFSCFHFLLSFD